MTDRHDEIARRAYRIWEDAGRPEGQEVEHWTAAEAELSPEAGDEPQHQDTGGLAEDSSGDPLPMSPADDESVPPAVTRTKAGGARRKA
jgi:hypothetical protein